MDAKEKQELDKMATKALTTLYHEFRHHIDSLCLPLMVEWATETGGTMLLIENGQAVGFLMVIDGYIDGIYVREEYRRRGIARDGVMKYIRDHGMPQTLHTVNTNNEAKKFWHSIFQMHRIDKNNVDTLWQIDGLKER